MSQTNIATQTMQGPFPVAFSSGLLKLLLTAADSVNGNSFVSTNREVLLVYNTDSASHNLTISSAPDNEKHRSGDLTAYAIPAGEMHAFDFRGGDDGWRQSNGKVNFIGADATLKFAVVTNP
jgi:hypothetical protein